MKVVITYTETRTRTAEVDVNEDEYAEWLLLDHGMTCTCTFFKCVLHRGAKNMLPGEDIGDLKEFLESGREPWFDEFPQEWEQTRSIEAPHLIGAFRKDNQPPIRDQHMFEDRNRR